MFAVVILLAGALQPGQLQNDGKPMSVAAECGEEDIRALGLTCPHDEPCPVYLELTHMERVLDKIFLAGNLHTDSATLSSILLASIDGGKTWHEPFERVRGASLDLIQFYDLESGWIAGQHVQALPRDPFFLLTTDGGKTWRRRPVWGESKVGVIDHFRFESKQKGLLWIDRVSSGEGGRYELYESMTGGESWMIREMSDRPFQPEKPGRPANSNWRLRADRASDSYVIERREGKWQALASFRIRAGECREPEPKLAEPPPPEAQPEAPPQPPPAPRRPPTLKRKPGSDMM